MGVAQSTEYESGSELQEDPNRLTIDKISKSVGLFRAAEDTILDSTDSEITLEDPKIKNTTKKHNRKSRSLNKLPTSNSKTSKTVGTDDFFKSDTQSELALTSTGHCTCDNVGLSLDSSKHGFGDVSKSRMSMSNGVNNNKVISTEVMQDYQRFSREPPEKDQNQSKCPVPHNMNGCCRACCIPLQKRLENQDKNIYLNRCPRHSNFEHNGCNSTNCPNNQKTRQSKSSTLNNKAKVYKQGPARGSSLDDKAQIPLPPPPPKRFSHTIEPGANNRSFNSGNRRSNNKTQDNQEGNKQMYNSHNYNYNKQTYKPFPYEEPSDQSYTTPDECCGKCSGFEQCIRHRVCKCQCACVSDSYYHDSLSDDQVSNESDTTDCMHLAYQKAGEYPELVDELENTLSQRNRMRVQKTMQQFEILSKQNKNLDKPIFDDDETLYNGRQNQRHQVSDNKRCKCQCCKSPPVTVSNKQQGDGFKSRASSIMKRAGFQPTPFPRSSGYVEKVARYMDPNFIDKPQRYAKNSSQNNGNGSWQMDTRKNEWVKVNSHTQYDFESCYPPLPSTPRSRDGYDGRQPHGEYARSTRMERSCSCNKCNGCIRHCRS